MDLLQRNEMSSLFLRFLYTLHGILHWIEPWTRTIISCLVLLFDSMHHFFLFREFWKEMISKFFFFAVMHMNWNQKCYIFSRISIFFVQFNKFLKECCFCIDINSNNARLYILICVNLLKWLWRFWRRIYSKILEKYIFSKRKKNTIIRTWRNIFHTINIISIMGTKALNDKKPFHRKWQKKNAEKSKWLRDDTIKCSDIHNKMSRCRMS